MTWDVVVVGSVNVDLLVSVDRHPAPGETVLGRSGALLPGGKGANQAVAAARLGARVALVGAVGSDANAGVATSGLVEAGVDLGAVSTVPGPTGLAVVTLADDGENSIVVVPGANALVDVAAVATAAHLIAAASLCVLQAEIPLTSAWHAAKVAADSGVRVVLNLAPAYPVPPETLVLADPLVVNEHEATLLLGWLGHAAPVSDVATARAAAVHLRALGVPSVVVTLGGSGAVGADADGSWSLPARQVVVRDTTGAGDAFVGALATRLAQGDTLRDAAATGVRVAAWSVQRLGAQSSFPRAGDPLP